MFSREIAGKLRAQVLQMTHQSGASHVGSCLSVIDILAVLYSEEFGITPESWQAKNANRVVLSKGHAAAALYAVLAEKGFITKVELESYCHDGSRLGGHPSHRVPGVELSTGSLGHGLPFGVGLAFAKKLMGHSGQVFVVMSDGELDEGSTWESALLAQHHHLDNLIVIVDRNYLQSLESTESTLSLEPLDMKFRAFNWETVSISGHNHEEIRTHLRNDSGMPKILLASTIKGYGVKFMENEVKWHYKSPDFEEYEMAISNLKELGLM